MWLNVTLEYYRWVEVTLEKVVMYSAPNCRAIASDWDGVDRPHCPVEESYSDASETGELYPPIQITGV